MSSHRALGFRLMATSVCIAFAAGMAIAAPPVPPAKSKPSTETEIRAALFGGVPDGRWKEGLLFEGIKSMGAEWRLRQKNLEARENSKK